MLFSKMNVVKNSLLDEPSEDGNFALVRSWWMIAGPQVISEKKFIQVEPPKNSFQSQW